MLRHFLLKVGAFNEGKSMKTEPISADGFSMQLSEYRLIPNKDCLIINYV